MTNDIELEGYCLKCKAKRILDEPAAEWSANGRPATRGKCPVCGGNMYKHGHTAAHDDLPKPEISQNSKAKSSKKNAGRKRKKKSARKPRRSGKLVIVESPAKARTIGRYLGSGYKVMSSVGHVRDLLRSRLSVDVENNYVPEYRVPNEKRKVVKELKEAGARGSRDLFGY